MLRTGSARGSSPTRTTGIGRVTAAIDPPLAGRVVIGDAEWTAVADVPIAVGSDVKVVYNRNLTMKVEEIK